jgi:type III pantothenate kinase
MGALLAVDIGNTNIVMGVYRGSTLVAHWRLTTSQKRTEDELEVFVRSMFAQRDVTMTDISAVALACVAPQTLPPILRFLRRAFDLEPLVIGPGVKTGVVIASENPREVGADRIANVAGALDSHPSPLIVVDFGTAITFDAVSAKSEYLGGAIVPGIRMSLSALYHHAAKLPEVAMERPSSIIGRNTVHAMQAGAYFGYAALVDGIVARMKESLGGEVTVIATGGEAAAIAEAAASIDCVEEWLTLEGIRVIREKNVK